MPTVNAAASATSAGQAPNEQVLNGLSLTAPSLTSFPGLGTLAAWNQGGQIYFATDMSNPPYQAEVVNSAWTTVDTPAIALALTVNQVYLAWLDNTGTINLASTADGWQKATPLVSGGAVSPPALVFSNEDQILYAAWKDGGSGCLFVGTLDQKGNFQSVNTGCPIDSRPSIMLDGRTLRILTGGDQFGTGGQVLMVSSKDNGQTFQASELPFTSIGPPALVNPWGTYCLVYADPERNSSLTVVYSNDLVHFQNPVDYSDGCHAGGPAATVSSDGKGITPGWSYGSADWRLHHITVAEVPLDAQSGASQIALQDSPFFKILQQMPRPLAKDPCASEPGTVFDPSTGDCVPKLGCWGQCILSSYVTVWNMPVFNPIKYAMCVGGCLTKSQSPETAGAQARS